MVLSVRKSVNLKGIEIGGFAIWCESGEKDKPNVRRCIDNARPNIYLLYIIVNGYLCSKQQCRGTERRTQDPGSHSEPQGTLHVFVFVDDLLKCGITSQIELGNLPQGHLPCALFLVSTELRYCE